MADIVQKKSLVWPWVWAILAVIYFVSPVDLVPDVVPFAGWIDDPLILLTGIVNLLQRYAENARLAIAHLLKVLKWILLVLSILVVLVFGLIVGLLFAWIF